MSYQIECVVSDKSSMEIFTLGSNDFIIDNFRASELACPTDNRIKVDKRFLEAVRYLRELWGRPLVVNSFCRSTVHNTKVGGHPRSLHLMDNPHWPTLGTIAVDFCTIGWSFSKVEEFLDLAWEMGFSQGNGSNFVHLDFRCLIGLTQTIFNY